MVVFTKQEYRSVSGPILTWGRPARAGAGAGQAREDDEHETDEAEAADAGGIAVAVAAPRKRQRKASSSGSGSNGSRKAAASKVAGPKGRNRMTFKDWQQRTLDEYAVRSS
jgi:hypothetical protein